MDTSGMKEDFKKDKSDSNFELNFFSVWSEMLEFGAELKMWLACHRFSEVPAAAQEKLCMV